MINHFHKGRQPEMQTTNITKKLATTTEDAKENMENIPKNDTKKGEDEEEATPEKGGEEEYSEQL